MSSSSEPTDVSEFEIQGISSPTSNDVSSAINKLDRTDPERYLVKWSGSKHLDYASAYNVAEIGFGAGGAPNLKLVGKRGGRYTIDSNPGGRPRVIRESDGYEERLSEIKIYSLEFDWEHWIKRRLGLD